VVRAGCTGPQVRRCFNRACRDPGLLTRQDEEEPDAAQRLRAFMANWDKLRGELDKVPHHTQDNPPGVWQRLTVDCGRCRPSRASWSRTCWR
jgi:hypothetical protein